MAANVSVRQLVQAAEWSLLGIVVLLHAASWVWLDKLANAGPLAVLWADSIPLATVILAAAWIGLGPGTLWLRGPAFALLLLWAIEFSRYWGPTNLTLTDRQMAYSACSMLVVAIGLRAWGLKVIQLGHDHAHDGNMTFSVRLLFAITTAIAVAIGGLEGLRPWLNSEPAEIQISTHNDRQFVVAGAASTPWRVVEAQLKSAQKKGQLRVVLACASLTTTSLLAVVTVLLPGAIWLRATGLAMLVPAFGWYLGHLTDADSESTATLTCWILAVVALVAGSLIPLRLMGYRLARPPKGEAPSPSSFLSLPRFTFDRDHLATNQAVTPSAEVHS